MKEDFVVSVSQLKKFWDRVDKSGGPSACWPWTGSRNKHGYGRLWWLGKYASAHRVAVQLDGRSVDNLCVLHDCDNTFCVNPLHLTVGTQKQNMQDASARGRMGWSLSTEQVIVARVAVASGVQQKRVASLLGGSGSNMSFVVRGVTRVLEPGPCTVRGELIRA